MYKKVILFLIIAIGYINFSLGQSEIQLKPYFRGLKSVKVEIEKKTYNFLFDTAGGITMISPQVLQDLKRKSFGRSVGFRMDGEKIETQLCDSIEMKIGGASFFHDTVGVFDLMELLPKDFKRLDGVISLKTFENSRISLLLDEDRIIVETPESFHLKTNNLKAIPSRFANGLGGLELNIFLEILEKGNQFWFLFDTGNIASTIISNCNVTYFNITDQKDKFQHKLSINDISITSKTSLKDIIYDGVLGFHFIKQSTFLISFPDKKVFIIK